MTQTISHYNDVVLPDGTPAFFNLITELSGFEDDNLEVVGSMERDTMSPVQYKKAHIHGIGVAEGPDMEPLTTDLPVDERVGAFPRVVAFCAHSHR